MTAVVGCSDLRRAQHVHAVAAAHLQVAQHDVELALVQLLDRHVAVRRLFDFVTARRPARGRGPRRSES